MQQEVKIIKISDLSLWTENPRDPIGENIGDLEIIKRAINNEQKRWNLPKLIKEMGSHYDCSEIPTVIKKENKWLILDGNRRIAILKYAQNPTWADEIEGPLFPSTIPDDFKNRIEIPCNICDRETAIINIFRKHRDKGTWNTLETEIAKEKFLQKPKSTFLIFEESTGLISKNQKLNQDFVRDEVLTKENLKKIGFDIQNGKAEYRKEDGKKEVILNNICLAVNEKIITTRNNRGDLVGVLEKISSKEVHTDETHTKETIKPKLTPRTTTKKDLLLFREELSLVEGEVNNLYRDIEDLYSLYLKNKLSENFPSLIRMSLRLICETVKDDNKDLNALFNGFDDIKKKMSSDEKTILHANTVTKDNIVSLLHIGAHNYSTSKNIEQTKAIAIFIKEILKSKFSKK